MPLNQSQGLKLIISWVHNVFLLYFSISFSLHIYIVFLIQLSSFGWWIAGMSDKPHDFIFGHAQCLKYWKDLLIDRHKWNTDSCGSQSCALRKITRSPKVLHCAIQGIQHKAYMKKVSLSGDPKAEISCLRHPGALRAQPWKLSNS